MPELKPLRLLAGDVLYQQKDHADEIYMIKNGKVKLNVDISDFIIEENKSAFLQDYISGNQEEDEEGKSVGYQDLSFPFIQYVEGSYFGDCDLLIPGLRVFERDSTAVAWNEVHLFVLSRDIIN